VPLVVVTLGNALEAAFAAHSDSAAQVANDMATAYDSYCKAALAGGIPPLLTPAAKSALMGMLLGAIESGNGTPAQMGQAWAAGIQMYWMSPPILFTAPPIVGTVTAMPGAASVPGAISGVLSNPLNTAATAAQGIAAALDVATKTVLVTFTAPPPPTGPPPPATVV